MTDKPRGIFMSPEEFNQMAETTHQTLVKLWTAKGAEYSGDTNRLENFVRNAKLTGVAPEVVLMIYMGKHFDSLTTYAKDINNAFTRTYTEPITGRWDDLIAYAFLGKAMAIARERMLAPSEALISTKK